MRSQGSVGCYVYKEYFKAGGGACYFAAMVWLFLFAQILATMSDMFLSEWYSCWRVFVCNILHLFLGLMWRKKLPLIFRAKNTFHFGAILALCGL